MGEIFDIGLRNYWSNVNHVAIVVTDIGRSVNFYSGVIGMNQIIRPDFDRHGAWLTFGNVDLHLIKGKPAVHSDQDLIVGHIAVIVDTVRMEELRIRLMQLGYPSRRNVSVPNPELSEVVSQAFVRDPDGYYIEFCACQPLESYLSDAMAKNRQETMSISRIVAFDKFGKILCEKAVKSKKNLEDMRDCGKKLAAEQRTPDWMDGVDESKLANLMKRRETYCDITQNADEDQLKRLLVKHSNHIPAVIQDLELWVRTKGSYTAIPP